MEPENRHSSSPLLLIAGLPGSFYLNFNDLVSCLFATECLRSAQLGTLEGFIVYGCFQSRSLKP